MSAARSSSPRMTSEAKRALSKVIRGLREKLLVDLFAATEGAYRLSIARVDDAGLPEARRERRRRLERHLDEQVRAEVEAVYKRETGQAPGQTPKKAKPKKKASAKKSKAVSRDDIELRLVEREGLKTRLLRDVVKEAAYTWLNRLVVVRLMEGMGLRDVPVLTGGWDSPGYKDFRSLARALVKGDDTEGYAFLLQLIFDDLAQDLPGIFGKSGAADLIPMPSALLRHVIAELDQKELASCWADDMTLGWVYQYWNDPEREALDKKLNDGGKVEPHEIASKTQMFTERYMVDWLLQNTLGPMWLALCKKHGWTPECESDGTLAALEERRTAWRKRVYEPHGDDGEVDLTALMPLENDAEHRWAYYLPQPIPDEAVKSAPESVRDLKLLDPAVGSGHFLVVAFELLFALYQEEARHRGESEQDQWQDSAIVIRILSHNLHGIDLDPRAVQIAAAALWLKARTTCADAKPERLNLVASHLRLAHLKDDDPALHALRKTIEDETGIPGALTDEIVQALRGADHLGSLLKVDAAVGEAIAAYERGTASDTGQGDLFGKSPSVQERPRLPDTSIPDMQRSVTDALETFLAAHTKSTELGLRLFGEQLAAGVRFLRLVRPNSYDIVVGNPPYQGTSKMAETAYIDAHYKLGKADLYAAFLLRGLELVRPGGVSALLTMRNWMFIKTYADLREHLLERFDLRALHDLSSGAFEEISAAQVVVSVVSSVFAKEMPNPGAVALKVFDDDTVTDIGETLRKRAATLAHVGRHEFDAAALKVVPEWPLVYWWGEERMSLYLSNETIGTAAPAVAFQSTSGNVRFLRAPSELRPSALVLPHEGSRAYSFSRASPSMWVPCVNGADGEEWLEPMSHAVHWTAGALELRVNKEFKGQGNGALANEDRFFHRGVCFTMVGNSFSARAHVYPSYCADKGNSLFPESVATFVCWINTRRARSMLEDLNPSISFQSGDVNKLPMASVRDARRVFEKVELAESEERKRDERSLRFCRPGPSPWRYAQEWAQSAVDRPEGEPLPRYEPEYDPEPPTDHISFALGVALGRFGAKGEGILDPEKDDLTATLPAGICFLDGTLDETDHRDSLGHDAASIIHDKWREYGPTIDDKRGVREYLRTKFFADVHKGMYENRPIHFPLSSEKKTFVAWVNIHRWDQDTLRVLLADHLLPALTRLSGEREDLSAARHGNDKSAARDAEARFAKVDAWRSELEAFIALVEQCAERGPPPTDAKCPAREVDARYAPNLDDGVMINSAALWPLLEPQWKDPKKWYLQLAKADPKGNKDYDWSHLAMRYWPKRVDEKCRKDPSLGVAHGCFWKYHPARAWAWELRLQHEIGPAFCIEEAPYAAPGEEADGGDAEHRAAYLKAHAAEALAAVEKEVLRRNKKDDAPQVSLRLLETVLWDVDPAGCVATELALSGHKSQQVAFVLEAPNADQARAAYLKAHREAAEKRQQVLSKLSVGGLFEEPKKRAGAKRTAKAAGSGSI